MPATVVVGSQWGDEGKGRVVDLLAAEADLIVRYQGGNNAGHTVWVGEERFALHLVPTGILRNKPCLLGGGMVLDLEVLLKEEEGLAARGVAVRENLRISETAHLILPYHKLLEAAEEERRGSRAIGTTRRGIGPAYEDKIARRGLRVGDLADPKRLREQLSDLVSYKNLLLDRIYGQPGLDADEICDGLLGRYQQIADRVCDASVAAHQALREGQSVLFEGAHGTMLDIDWGTYPFVTSSNPLSGAVTAGIGVGPQWIERIVGAAKAYTTRVGAGPFPTEVEEEVASTMRDTGGEYGTTTGRARRIGWFDAMVVRKSARINGLSALAITHLDVLSQFEAIPVCVGYTCDGKTLAEFPNDIELVSRCQPVYESLPAWKEDISGVRNFADLPANAQAYVKRIEELVAVPVSHILVGRQRDQDIII